MIHVGVIGISIFLLDFSGSFFIFILLNNSDDIYVYLKYAKYVFIDTLK
jgi:hypothetical protein